MKEYYTYTCVDAGRFGGICKPQLIDCNITLSDSCNTADGYVCKAGRRGGRRGHGPHGNGRRGPRQDNMDATPEDHPREKEMGKCIKVKVRMKV